jgi:hypothetical protein
MGAEYLQLPKLELALARPAVAAASLAPKWQPLVERDWLYSLIELRLPIGVTPLVGAVGQRCRVLDQTFTVANFRRVYDIENRKGLNLEKRFFPELEPLTDDIRRLKRELATLYAARETLSPADFATDADAAIAALNAAKELKDATINDLLAALGNDIRANNLRLILTQKEGPKGKHVYLIQNTAAAFFAVKQVQWSLHRLYRVKQANRNHTVSAARQSLDNDFPLAIIRTDIASFYESVDRSSITARLDEDHLLSLSAKRIVHQILGEYGRITGSPRGIPRGVGLSAYLAEIYLRPLDAALRTLPGVIFYGRYVDDILIVFSPPTTGTPIPYDVEVGRVVAEHGLTVNSAKTKYFDTAQTSQRFEYLGYRFDRRNGSCKLELSGSKIFKYRRRLQVSFRDYFRDRPKNQRRSARALISRIKFLTGNSRLAHNKSHAVTGIFYSNSEATDIRILGVLDQYLHRKIDEIGSPALEDRLRTFSFRRGFEQRAYHSFTTRELGQIVKAWRYA